MEKVAKVLQTIKTKAAAEAALLATGDGLVLEGISESDADLEAIAAYAASYVSVSERLAADTQLGQTQSVIVLYRGKALVIAPLGGPVMVVVVGSGTAHLGNLRLQLGRGLPALVGALHEELPEMTVGANGTAPAAAPVRGAQRPWREAPAISPPTSDRSEGSLRGEAAAHAGPEAPPAEPLPTPAGTAESSPRAVIPPDDHPFTRRIEVELRRAQEHGAEFSVAVLALEGFGERRTPIGRKGQEDLTHLFGERLKKALRAADMAAQLDDVTFGVLFAGVNREQARAIVLRISAQALDDNLQRSRSEITFRVHAGVAAFPEAGSSPDRLLQRAIMALFVARIEAALGQAKEHPGEVSVAVIAVDGLEIAGPTGGDTRGQLTPLFAKRLQQTLRTADMAARLDDGKVGVLLTGVNHDQAKAIVQRITAQALQDNLGLPRRVTGHVRAGIATFPEAGTSAETLLRRAEATIERIAP